MSNERSEATGSGISRRNFLAGAGAAIATGALAGGLPSAYAQDAGTADTDQYIDSGDNIYRNDRLIHMENVGPIATVAEPASYDYETDVLIIGFGVGGTSAALTCVNKGVTNVIAMESSLENNWYEHGGLHTVAIPGVKEWLDVVGLPVWNEAVVDMALNQEYAWFPFSQDDRAARKQLMLETVNAFEQVRALGPGAQFEKVVIFDWMLNQPMMIPQNDNIEGGNIYHPWVNKYHGVENVIRRYVEGKGVKVVWGTSASNLIKDSDGRVIGAKGVNVVDGSEVFVKAKCTILSTGGYGANYDMIKYYGLMDELSGCYVGPLTNNGSGQRIAQGAGCGVRGIPRWTITVSEGAPDNVSLGLPWTFVQTPYKDRQVSGYTHASIQLARQPVLKVNANGNRFASEESSWEKMIWCEFQQPRHRVYTIFDGDIEDVINTMYFKQNRYGMCERLIYPDLHVYFNDEDIRPMWKWQDQLQESLKAGSIVQADTLEELAGKLGLSADNLLATVERYNGFCDSGVDADYGKNAKYLFPVRKAPFYGMERTPSFVWIAPGGVATDCNGRVMTNDGTAIPGLYCGSNEAAVCDAEAYNMTMTACSGGGGFAIGMGYIAGKNAADEVLA